MTKPIPQSVIIKSYFWQFSAEAIVIYFKSCGYRQMSATELRERWDEEFAWNPVMQDVGQRPTAGFEQTEKIKLAELVAA